jgi:hypothetical protein
MYFCQTCVGKKESVFNYCLECWGARELMLGIGSKPARAIAQLDKEIIN